MLKKEMFTQRYGATLHFCSIAYILALVFSFTQALNFTICAVLAFQKLLHKSKSNCGTQKGCGTQ